MSRQSAASLAVVPVAAGIESPDPPPEFNDAQASQWDAIIDAMPPNFFTPEMYPLVEQLCVHACISRGLVGQINQIGQGSRQDEDRLLKLISVLVEEAKFIVTASTKLRLTPQSRYGHRKTNSAVNRHNQTAPTPW